jgi:hypothetical protein
VPVVDNALAEAVALPEDEGEGDGHRDADAIGVVVADAVRDGNADSDDVTLTRGVWPNSVGDSEEEEGGLAAIGLLGDNDGDDDGDGDGDSDGDGDGDSGCSCGSDEDGERLADGDTEGDGTVREGEADMEMVDDDVSDCEHVAMKPTAAVNGRAAPELKPAGT